MKTGIIVYSQSGHTASFARAIADQIREAGLDCDVELLRPHGIPKPWTRNIQFRRIPEVAEYDVILFGAPVWAFSVSPVLRASFTHIDSIKGKKVLPFVTHGLPLSIGPKRALKQLSNELDFLQADVLEGESEFFFIFTTNKQKMKAAAERIVKRIQE